MRISILGYHGTLSKHIGIRLVKEGHNVIYIGKDIDKKIYKNKNAKYINLELNSNLLKEVFQSMNFDVLIFINSHDIGTNILKDLELTLESSLPSNIMHYIYISTVDVYGDKIRCEDKVPIPINYNSINSLCGEKYFDIIQKSLNITYTILRTSSIYDIESKDGTLLNDFINKCINYDQDIIVQNPNIKQDFINVLDVSDAVYRVIANKIEGIYNIASGKLTSYKELEYILKTYKPSLSINYNDLNIVNSQDVNIKLAIKTLDWIPIHNIDNDIKNLIDNIALINNYNKKIINFKFNINKYSKVKPYIEVIVSYIIFVLLRRFIEYNFSTMFIDTRLIFVVIAGSTYGFRLGILAGLLTVTGYYVEFLQQGHHILDLVYNINYWIPLIIYVLTGAITGFTHDNYIKEIDFIKADKKIVQGKHDFMFFLFSEMRDLKNDLQRSLANYEGSLGKVYTIEQRLNTLDVEELYFSAIKILEDIMNTTTCSIYATSRNSGTARLIVRSKSLVNTIPNHIFFNKVNYIKPPQFENIGIFVNKELDKGVPSYCSTIYYEGEPKIFIMIWEAKFEQFSHYYKDLFKLVSLYIGNALYRAYKHYQVIHKSLYLPESIVYSQEAFKEILATKEQMKEKNMADFSILKINNPEVLNNMEFEDLNFIRSTDFFGIGKDGNTYLFLLMDGKENIIHVLNRLKSLNIDSIVVDELSNVV